MWGFRSQLDIHRVSILRLNSSLCQQKNCRRPAESDHEALMMLRHGIRYNISESSTCCCNCCNYRESSMVDTLHFLSFTTATPLATHLSPIIHTSMTDDDQNKSLREALREALRGTTRVNDRHQLFSVQVHWRDVLLSTLLRNQSTTYTEYCHHHVDLMAYI